MNKILIIDDDFAVQTSLSLMLRQEGFQVKTCSSPVLAMDVIEEFQPQLIILDLNFSIETSGDEGMKALKIIRHTFPNIAVILLTGWGTINLAVEGMKLGAKDFVTKPWQNGYIIQSINTILNLSQQKIQSPKKKKKKK
eukprot:Opistho-2@74504